MLKLEKFNVETIEPSGITDWQYSSRLRSRMKNNCCFMLCLHL